MDKSNDDSFVKEMLEYYDNKFPNPEMYPIQAKFLIDSFTHHKNMRGSRAVVVRN